MNVLSLASAAGKPSADIASFNAAGSTDSGQRGGFHALLQSGSTSPPDPATATATAKRSNHDRTAAAESVEPAQGQTPSPASSAATNKADRSDDTGDDETWPPYGLTALVSPPASQLADAELPTPNADVPEGDIGQTITTASQLNQHTSTPEKTSSVRLDSMPTLAVATNADEIELLVSAVTSDSDAGSVKGIADAAEAADPKSFNMILQGITTPANTRPLSDTTASTAIQDTPVPLHGDNFDDAIGARISWLAEQKIGHAQIRITPHDLGQIDVKLQLEGDRVHATFTSAHAEVRHALEASVPRLREMLNEQGLQLAQADVGDQSSQQSAPQAFDSQGLPADDADSGNDIGSAGITSRFVHQRGLLDTYA